MTILILSAIFAFAAAAPSGSIVGPIGPVPIGTVPLGPIPIPSYPIPAIKTLPSPAISAFPIVGVKTLTAIPIAAPTISPGDIQAAAINAKVEVEDYLRATAEQQREINEQALKEQAEKIVEVSNQHGEKNQEAFWEVEDKKWQALNALQTAQAKIDGIVASNAELLGKTVLKPTLINPGIVPIAPGLAPISSYSFSTVAINEGEKPQEKKEEMKTEEVKTEEVKSQEVKSEEVSQDSVQIESADNNKQALAAVKTPAAVAENEQKIATAEAETKLKEAGIIGPVVANLGFPLYAPIAGVPVNLNEVVANLWKEVAQKIAIADAEATLTEGGIIGPVVANLGFPLYAPIVGVPVNLNEVGWQATLLQPGVKILTPGLSLAQGGIVASVAGRSAW